MVLLAHNDPAPLYQQLASGLKREIQEGRLVVGAKMPPSRDFAVELGVSRNTVLNAIEQLKAEGYLESRRGAGIFVSGGKLPCLKPPRENADLQRPKMLSRYATRVAAIHYTDTDNSPENWLDFSYGRTRLNDRRVASLLRGTGAASQLGNDYSESQGLLSLRKAIVEHLRRQRGLFISLNRVIVTSGTQQSLDLCAKVLLDEGDTVVMEDPHYESARMVFQALGASIQTITVDDNGLPTRELAGIGARVLYATPSHQFPTGAVLPVQRRIELLEWARRNNAYVIEDDYDSEFRYDVRPLQPIMALDTSESVIYCGTFSKSLLPGLRLGYLIAPEALFEPLRMAKLLADRGSSKILQSRLASLIQSGGYARHVHRLANTYSRARARLVSELTRHFGKDIQICGANAGVHLLVWFNRLDPCAASSFVAESAEDSVTVASVSHCYLNAQPQRLGLLLGYSAIDASSMPEAVDRLKKSYDRVLSAERNTQHV